MCASKKKKPCNGSTSLEISTLVSPLAGSCSRLSSPYSPVSQSINPGGSVPLPDPPPAGRMAYLKQQYEEGGFSCQARELLSAAWRKNTSDQYASARRKWTGCCSPRKINPVSASPKNIINFLASEFLQGKQYQTLNVYRSAISMTHSTIDFMRIRRALHGLPAVERNL